MAKANKEEDVRGTKGARAVLGRRGIDVAQADVRCMHGVLHIRGVVRAIPGNNILDIKAEMENVAKVLRTRVEIHDVILECTYKQ